jgi:hypothetical protein
MKLYINTLLTLIFLLTFYKCSKNQLLPEIVEKWKETTVEYSGIPMNVRINTGLKPVIGHSAYSYHVGISIPANKSIAHENEAQKIKFLEQKIISIFTDNTLCLVACIMESKDGMEIIMYTGKPKIVKEKFKALRKEITTHELQLNIRKDTKWFTYNQYSP